MTGKISKTKKPTKTVDNKNKIRINSAQIMFAVFAIILILSMVLSAVTKF